VACGRQIAAQLHGGHAMGSRDGAAFQGNAVLGRTTQAPGVGARISRRRAALRQASLLAVDPTPRCGRGNGCRPRVRRRRRAIRRPRRGVRWRDRCRLRRRRLPARREQPHAHDPEKYLPDQCDPPCCDVTYVMQVSSHSRPHGHNPTPTNKNYPTPGNGYRAQYCLRIATATAYDYAQRSFSADREVRNGTSYGHA
jgi:hypothetical protein